MHGDHDILFGRIALAWGWVRKDVLLRALDYQRQHAPQRRLGDLLVEHGYLTRAQAEQVAAAQAQQARTGRHDAVVPPPGQQPPGGGWTPTAPQSPPHGVAGWAGALAAAPPAQATGVALGPTPRPEDEDPLLGTVLGGCFINAKIGAGAMGVCYLAYHGELRKDVVVKVLNPEQARNARTVERFRREASAMARVEHQNVVMVFHVGTTQDERPFMVMQYVDGGDLAKKVREAGRLDPREATRIVLEVARGLQAAHERELIHRDVKPENILLTASGVAKVTDFGLAKDMTLESMTIDGARIGTPLYMAPEIGGKAPIDGRADVYSLGLTFFYLLTGVEALRGFAPMDIYQHKAHARIKPPEAHVPDVPRSHRRVLSRMLAFDRDARHPDMAAAVRDLEALLRGEEVPAPTGGLWPEPGSEEAQVGKSSGPRRRTGRKPPARKAHDDGLWQVVLLAGGGMVVLALVVLVVLLLAGVL